MRGAETSFPDEWKQGEGNIYRTYGFLSEDSMVRFIHLINEWTEKVKRHPDAVVPGKLGTVSVIVSTDNSVTREDFIYAKGIDKLYKLAMRGEEKVAAFSPRLTRRRIVRAIRNMPNSELLESDSPLAFRDVRDRLKSRRQRDD